MSFPLHRLPFLAFSVAVRNLEVDQKLALFMTSQKTKRIMSSISKLPIDVEFENCRFPNKVGIHLYHMYKKLVFLTIDDDVPEGLEDILDFLKTCCNIESVTFLLDDEDPIKSRQLVETVMLKDWKIQNFMWRTDKYDENSCQKMFRAVGDAKTVHFFNHIDESFKFDGFSKYATKNLWIIKAQFITVANLCDLVNCLSVTLKRTFLTSQDFNFFLKYVMTNDVKIKKWCINTEKEINWAVMFDGLESRKQENDCWVLEKPDGIKYHINLAKDTFMITKHE